MSKIICDICGTTYPDTADCCPICGCSRDAVSDILGEDFMSEELMETAPARGGRFSEKKKKEIFDFDEVNPTESEEDFEDEDDDLYEEEEEVEEESRGHNIFIVILLTILIAGLLLAAGFIFFRYFLPNMNDEKTESPEATVYTEEVRLPETTELRVPCKMLILSSGTAELSKEGQFFLMHVQATPEDTTDEIVYTSGDESIATVTEDGRITAVSEGETVIYITCGNVQTTCPVVVKYEEETLPPTEATVPAETEAETVPDDVPETTVSTEPAVRNDVTLKLKQSDIRLGVYYEYQLLLDCDLEQTEVEWKSEHPHIATVDEKGVIKAVKDGTTSIIVKYGDQEVSCIVRCSY